jgi:hypothetical protein
MRYTAAKVAGIYGWGGHMLYLRPLGILFCTLLLSSAGLSQGSLPVTLGYRELAFNELAHEWHSDHVFRHDPNCHRMFLAADLPGWLTTSSMPSSR